ncbi:MAG: hypothetical protein LBC82_04765 [Oscillospiraceae bacterium]|jgi:hypothetical protein|nr:hypothetical protein [Oscillospiraceae bacterium]
MKNKKIVFPVIIVMTVLIVVLCGCKSRNPEVNNETQVFENPTDNNEVLSVGLPTPTIICNVEGRDFKKEIIDKVITSRSENIGEYQEENNYDVNRISEITEFFFPTVEIDGFKLHSVFVTETTFRFMYAPFEIDDDFEVLIGSEGLIIISLRRNEWYAARNVLDHFNDEVKQAQAQGWGHLTEDDMLYDAEFGNITAKIGETSIHIDVPRELGNYEFLRNLALRTIETIELVDVQAEIDIIRQSEN